MSDKATGLNLSAIWDTLATCRKAGSNPRFLVGHPDDGAVGRLAAQEFVLTWCPRAEAQPGRMLVTTERPDA